MAITERELEQAEERMATLRDTSHAVSARYDRRRPGVVVTLDTGVELTFPAQLAEGLENALADDLADIGVNPAGLGLHWPRLSADLYVPALLRGILGSTQWMARQLGRLSGRSRTASEVAASARMVERVAAKEGRNRTKPPPVFIDRFYERLIPVADELHDVHLQELK